MFNPTHDMWGNQVIDITADDQIIMIIILCSLEMLTSMSNVSIIQAKNYFIDKSKPLFPFIWQDLQQLWIRHTGSPIHKMFVQENREYQFDRKALYGLTMHLLGWSQIRAIEKGFGYHAGAYDAPLVEKVRAFILTLPYDIRFALLEKLETKLNYFLDKELITMTAPLDVVNYLERQLEIFGLNQPAPLPVYDPLSDLRPPVNYLNMVLGN